MQQVSTSQVHATMLPSEEKKIDHQGTATPLIEKAPTPLRICCYGSSSSRTPSKYTDAAYNLGYFLGQRGHTCVNGAGASGCMAAMNHGANDGDGAIVGVIHEAFVVDGSDWFEGAHSVFNTSKHRIITAKGNDLQERKKMLVEGADGLVVLPGGPGTWDELWEMSCARHIGFHSIPIVCVNVDGYYDNFKAILLRAHEDELLYKHPDEILHFEESAEAAVKWIEEYNAKSAATTQPKKVIRRRSSLLKRMQSNLSGMSAWGRTSSFLRDNGETVSNRWGGRRTNATIFAAGIAVGMMIGLRKP